MVVLIFLKIHYRKHTNVVVGGSAMNLFTRKMLMSRLRKCIKLNRLWQMQSNDFKEIKMKNATEKMSMIVLAILNGHSLCSM